MVTCNRKRTNDREKTAATTWHIFFPLTCAREECCKEFLIVTQHTYSSKMTFFDRLSLSFVHQSVRCVLFQSQAVVVFSRQSAPQSMWMFKECEGWIEKESEEARERCTLGSCVSWPHFKTDLWGCREGRGVAFHCSPFLCFLWNDRTRGRAHKGRVRTSAWKPSTERWKSPGEVMVQKRNGQKYTAPTLE